MPEDDKAVRDVFLRDTLTGAVTLLSRATGAAGAPTTGDSNDASVSRNAQFVAFSTIGALTAEDTNDDEDIYRRDTVNGHDALVSKGDTGLACPARSATRARSSRRSRPMADAVVFPSVATNLGDDANATGGHLHAG